MENGKKVIADGFYPLRAFPRWVIDSHFEKAKSTMVNIGAFVKLDSSIDMERMADAINFVLNRYDIFRCRLVIHPETSDICQRFDAEVQKVVVEKVSDEEFKKRISELKKPYYLIDAPLYRIYLLQTPTAKYWYVDFYHAIMDGTSIAFLFLREVNLAYKGRKITRPTPSYAEYILEELNISPEELAEGQNYFFDILKRFDKKKHLPQGDIEVATKSEKTRWYFPIKNVSREFFRKNALTENTFFIAASMLALAKTIGVKESLITCIHNGRVSSKEFRLMGTLVEEIPIYCDFEKFSTVSELLGNVANSVSLGINYRRSLRSIYERGLEDETVTFILQKNSAIVQRGVFEIDGKPAEVVELPKNDYSAAWTFSLDIEIAELDESEEFSYLLALNFDASRYSGAFIEKFAATLDEIVLNLRDENKSVAEILRG